MEHDGCVGCKYENEDFNSKHCLGCTQNAIDKYKPMTNADKIRSMSDEELAEFMVNFEKAGGCAMCSIGSQGECYSISKCKDGYISWLKSEVKGSE